MAFFKKLKQKIDTSTCSDNQIMDELEKLVNVNVTVSDEQINKLIEEIVKGKRPLVKGTDRPCKKTKTQSRYFLYFNDIINSKNLNKNKDINKAIEQEKKKNENLTRQLEVVENERDQCHLLNDPKNLDQLFDFYLSPK
jgi:hypothetical protein